MVWNLGELGFGGAVSFIAEDYPMRA
jgi:hypothetical protein